MGLTVAQKKRILRGFVKNRQKNNAKISKMSIDIQGMTCYTGNIEQPIAQQS
jgi:hypothetical protein